VKYHLVCLDEDDPAQVFMICNKPVDGLKDAFHIDLVDDPWEFQGQTVLISWEKWRPLFPYLKKSSQGWALKVAQLCTGAFLLWQPPGLLDN